MFWTARHRRLGASLLAGLVLFAQVLTAAYACPRQATDGPASVQSTADCITHAPAAMDPDRPLLCRAHCDQGQQSPNAGVNLASAMVAMPVLLWVLPEFEARGGLEAPAYALANGPPRGAPPLYLSLRVLRN